MCADKGYSHSNITIERAAFDATAVNIRNTPHSVSFIRMQGKKVVSSIVILEMQAAGNLPSTSTTVSTVAVVQLPCRLN